MAKGAEMERIFRIELEFGSKLLNSSELSLLYIIQLYK